MTRRPLRVAQVIDRVSERWGGPQRLIRDTAGLLVTHGHDVLIVASDSDGPGRLSEEGLRADVDERIGWRLFHGASRYSFAAGLPTLLREVFSRVDLVHIHGVYSYPTSVAMSRAYRMSLPYVVHLHGGAMRWHHSRKRTKKAPFERAFLRTALSRSACAIALSELERQQSSETLRIDNIRVARPPIAPRRAAVPAEVDELYRRFELPRDSRLVTFMSRLSLKKGAPIALEAFRAIAATHPDAHLVIAGSDDEGVGGKLRSHPALGRPGDLCSRVTLTGALAGADKAALLESSSVFILPSADESFGLVLAEAMQAGVPVLTTPHVALAPLIRDYGAGVIAKRDARAMGEALADLLAAPQRLMAVGGAGRQLVAEQFSERAALRDLERIYDDALSFAAAAGACRGSEPSDG